MGRQSLAVVALLGMNTLSREKMGTQQQQNLPQHRTDLGFWRNPELAAILFCGLLDFIYFSLLIMYILWGQVCTVTRRCPQRQEDSV